MQSKRLDWIALVASLAVSVACGLLATLWHEGEAALLLGLVSGVVLGFVFPRGAWRWALILAAWVPVALALRADLVASSALAWCPASAAPGRLPVWILGLVPVAAVFGGVVADWILTEALRWLEFLSWQWLPRIKPVLRVLALVCGVWVIIGSGLLLVQPLHPYGLGESYCWDEYCFAVTQVKRVKMIGTGPHAVTAHGTFYVVTADMEAPWWGRFDWSNDAVFAIDYDGTNYAYSRPGQAASDLATHSRRSLCHKILGAGETETIVFDLPENVVQPRLLVRDTLGFDGFLGGMRRSLFYVKPAFNLRYD